MTTTAERAQARSDAPDAYPSGRRPNNSRARLRRSERHTERAGAFAVSLADVPC